MDQPRRVGYAQRLADLPQQIHEPPRRQRAVTPDQVLQAQARQVLHDVVVGAVIGAAVVVDLDDVRVGERGGHLDLALEPDLDPRVGHDLGPDQLDGAGALEEPVVGQVDLAHPAGTDPLPQVILAESPGLGGRPAQPGDRAGTQRRADRQDDQDQPVVGEEEDQRGRARSRPRLEPPHRLRMPQGQQRDGHERKQGERQHDDRGAAPALGDVEPVGEDQDGRQQHDARQRHLCHHRLAAQREFQHQPVLAESEEAGEQDDHPQLQGLEPEQRDRPPAPEQGDEAHEGQEDRQVDEGEPRITRPEDGAPPEDRGGMDQDVDQRQLAQPSPHEVRGLRDRAHPRQRRDRLPRGEAAGVVLRCGSGESDRPGLLR